MTALNPERNQRRILVGMPTLRSDVIDFASYLASHGSTDYRVDQPSRHADEVVDLFYGQARDEGEVMPWPKTHNLIRFRPGELTIWCGVNGHGKSNVTSVVALGFAEQGKRSMLMSFEMLPKRTLWRMCRQASGTNEPSPRYIRAFLKWADKHIYLLDHQGTASSELVLGALRYSVVALKTQHIFIDSLMKCSRGEDDYSGQKDFVDELTAAARELNVHIHLIHHVRKTENEFVVPGKFDAKGSGAISDQADNFIVVFRNKRKEAAMRKTPPDEQFATQPDCILNIDKQRNGEWEGQIGLWFDPRSLNYMEERGSAPKRIECDEPVLDIPSVAPGSPIAGDDSW